MSSSDEDRLELGHSISGGNMLAIPNVTPRAKRSTMAIKIAHSNNTQLANFKATVKRFRKSLEQKLEGKNEGSTSDEIGEDEESNFSKLKHDLAANSRSNHMKCAMKHNPQGESAQDEHPMTTKAFVMQDLGDTKHVLEKEIADSQGERGVYTGALSNSKGLPNGKGNMEYATAGRTYEGDWAHGVWNGTGCMSNGEGDYFCGEFDNNVKQGSGVMLFSDGRVFEGVFERGCASYGKMTFPDGRIEFKDFCIRSKTERLETVVKHAEAKWDTQTSSEKSKLSTVERATKRIAPMHSVVDSSNATNGTVYHDIEWENGKHGKSITRRPTTKEPHLLEDGKGEAKSQDGKITQIQPENVSVEIIEKYKDDGRPKRVLEIASAIAVCLVIVFFNFWGFGPDDGHEGIRGAKSLGL